MHKNTEISPLESLVKSSPEAKPSNGLKSKRPTWQGQEMHKINENSPLGTPVKRLPQARPSRLIWNRLSWQGQEMRKNTENSPLESLMKSLPEGAAGVDHFEPLMRFIPPFVRQRCLEGINVPAENRTVSIMFLIADMKVWFDTPCPLPEVL